jgi:hypothetical protein
MADSNDNGNGLTKDLSNGELLNIVMRGIADVRNELLEEIHNIQSKLVTSTKSLSNEIRKLDCRLSRDINNLSVKVDQNHVAFIKNIEDHDIRITKLDEMVVL